MPTYFGIAVAVTILVLFFFAAGYANNLIFFFVFFMTAMSMSGAYLTNRNIKNVKLSKFSLGSCYAGSESQLLVYLEMNNDWLGFSHDITLELWSADLKTNYGAAQIFELQTSTYFTPMPVVLPERGVYLGLVLKSKSDFPLGFLTAWKYLRLEERILVYPALKGKSLYDHLQEQSRDGQGVFKEHREFVFGDSYRQVDWKASSRARRFLIKKHEGENNQTLILSESDVYHLDDLESKLSQLTLWLKEAEQQNLSYALHFAHIKSEVSRGQEHLHALLESLATLPKENI